MAGRLLAVLSLVVAAAPAQGAFTCDPPAYYAGVASALKTQSGSALRATLSKLLSQATDKGYDFAWAGLKVADAFNGDPSTGKVIQLYPNRAWPADDTNGNGVGSSTGWNREHVWPNSRGLLDSGPDYTDLHNLHVEDCKSRSLCFRHCCVSLCLSPCA